MQGYTIAELSAASGLSRPAVKQRLRRAGVVPVSYAGPTAIYAEDALAHLGMVRRGRPSSKARE